jgi:hypothetical protein
MRKVLGSFGAILAAALVIAAVPVSAGATHDHNVGDLAAVVSDAPESLRAKRRDLEAHADLVARGGSYDAGDHVKFSFPTAVAATPAGAAGSARGGIGVEADAPYSVDMNGVYFGVPTATAASSAGVHGDLDELVWGALWL